MHYKHFNSDIFFIFLSLYELEYKTLIYIPSPIWDFPLPLREKEGDIMNEKMSLLIC